jgi:hypothetical protein
MANDPLQLDMSGFKPAETATPQQPQPAAPVGDLKLDMSGFKPAAPADQDQSSNPNESEGAKNFVQGQQGFWDAIPGGRVAFGGEKGLLETLHTVGAVPSQTLRWLGMDSVPNISFEEPEYLQAHGLEENVGKVGEGVLEFLMTDGLGSKALTGAGKLEQVAKITKMLEDYPAIKAALTTGIGALRMGAAQSAQSLAHGADAGTALEAGASTGLMGGSLLGLGNFAGIAKNPMVATGLRGLEGAAGVGIGYQGAKEALSEQRPDETPDAALARRVSGGIQAILGTKGAADSFKSLPSAAAKARILYTQDLMNKIDSGMFAASAPSAKAISGESPVDQTFMEKLQQARPNMIEILRNNPTADTPKSMSRSIQSYVDNVDAQVKARAEGARGYDQAQIQNFEEDLYKTLQKFQYDQAGKFGRSDAPDSPLDGPLQNAYDELINGAKVSEQGGNQRTASFRQGAAGESEPRNPDLFEAENIRQRWQEEMGEAPMRGERTAPLNAAKQIAADLLREKIYNGYTDLGVQGVENWRKQQAALIDIKDQLNNAQAVAERSNQVGVMSRLARRIGWGLLPAAFGHPIGAGAAEAGALADAVREYGENPEYKLQQAIKAAGKLAPEDIPQPIKPEFTQPAPFSPQPGGSAHVPAYVPPAGAQQTTQQIPKDVAAEGEKESPAADIHPVYQTLIAAAEKEGAPENVLEKMREVARENSPTEDQDYQTRVGRTLSKGVPEDIQTAMSEAGMAKGSHYMPETDMFGPTFNEPGGSSISFKKGEEVTPDALKQKLDAQKVTEKVPQDLPSTEERIAQVEKEIQQHKEDADIASERGDNGSVVESLRKQVGAFRYREYLKNFKPQIEGDVPHIPMPDSRSMENTIGHELAHGLVNTMTNGRARGVEIMSHLHPNADPENAAAILVMRPKELTSQTAHDYMTSLAAGGAAEELLDGYDHKTNQSIGTDRAMMHNILQNLGVTDIDQRNQLVESAYQRATEFLKQDDILGTLNKYRSGREPGLPQELHASRTRLADMNSEVQKSLEKLNAGNENRNDAGLGNRSGTAGGEAQSELEAGTPNQSFEEFDNAGKRIADTQGRSAAGEQEAGSDTASTAAEAVKFAGKPIPYMHNTEKSPDMGERFGQHLEPAGRYVVEKTPGSYLNKGWEEGTVTFQHPKIVNFGGGYQDASNWKQVLSNQYNGLTGADLSHALIRDGYDGVITLDKSGNTQEIVDLQGVKKPLSTVGTRTPTAAKGESYSHDSAIDFDHTVSEPKFASRLVSAVKDVPGFDAGEGTDRAKLNRFVTHVANNLKALYKSVPEETRQRTAQWYDGANKLTGDAATDNQISHPQSAGMMAVYSPQKDWDMNVDLHRRTLDILKNHQNDVTSPEMTDWMEKYRDRQAKAAKKPDQIAAVKDFTDALQNVQGKSFSQLTDPYEKSVWLRAYDEAHNPRDYRKIAPTGEAGDYVKTTKGVNAKVAWGTFNSIAKALSIYDNGSRDNISEQLGDMHKVRSFYNNIIEPNSLRGDVTVDTHAVAAGLLRPLSGNDTDVVKNFSSPKSAPLGLNGTYALYNEAYKRAAEDLDIPHPRMLQSVVWEAVRQLFPDTFKTEANRNGVDKIWSQYDKGKLTAPQARKAIFNFAESGVRANEEKQRPTNQVSVQDSQRAGAGQSGRASAGRVAAGLSGLKKG